MFLINQFKDIHYVIIHAGKAHRDEILTVCLLFGLIGKVVPVFRRDPTKEELSDPRVVVIDVGGSWNPLFNNYDHHRLPNRMQNECSLTLFAKATGLERLFENVPWYIVTAIMDCHGPDEVAKYLGVRQYPFDLSSPFEEGIKELVEDDEMTESDWKFLMKLGKKIIEREQKLIDGLDWLRKNAQFGYSDKIPVMFVNAPKVRGKGIYRREMNPEFDSWIGVSVTPDSRGHGTSIRKFSPDDDRLDFRIIKDDPRIHFFPPNKNKYIVKTKQRLCFPESLELINEAIPDRKIG